jgi:hypothetical protein
MSQILIKEWLSLIGDKNLVEKERKAGLRKIYQSFRPKMAEMIMEGDCKHNCLHCFYAKNYSKIYPNLNFKDWEKIIKKINQALPINTYIHCGRMMNRKGIQILKFLRKNYPKMKIGLIDDGAAILPFLDDLVKIQPDWIDISVDGCEKSHNKQRNQAGRFQKTLKTIKLLKQKRITPKINILTTITNINQKDILAMIRFLNQKTGLTNFFFSPVIDFKPWLDRSNLMISPDELIEIFKDLKQNLKDLDKLYLEFAFFEVDQIIGFLNQKIIEFKKAELEKNTLNWGFKENNASLTLSFEPFSLVGVKDCIINPAGKLIFNKSMAVGKRLNQYLPADVLTDDIQKVYENLSKKPVFKIYLEELEKERRLLIKHF